MQSLTFHLSLHLEAATTALQALLPALQAAAHANATESLVVALVSSWTVVDLAAAFPMAQNALQSPSTSTALDQLDDKEWSFDTE